MPALTTMDFIIILTALFGAAFCLAYIACSVLFARSLADAEKKAEGMTVARLKATDTYLFAGESARDWSEKTHQAMPWITFEFDDRDCAIWITHDIGLEGDLRDAKEREQAKSARITRRYKKVKKQFAALQVISERISHENIALRNAVPTPNRMRTRKEIKEQDRRVKEMMDAPINTDGVKSLWPDDFIKEAVKKYENKADIRASAQIASQQRADETREPCPCDGCVGNYNKGAPSPTGVVTTICEKHMPEEDRARLFVARKQLADDRERHILALASTGADTPPRTLMGDTAERIASDLEKQVLGLRVTYATPETVWSVVSLAQITNMTPEERRTALVNITKSRVDFGL